jgi:hypothetical protein
MPSTPRTRALEAVRPAGRTGCGAGGVTPRDSEPGTGSVIATDFAESRAAASRQPCPTTAAKNSGMSGMSGISSRDITVTSAMASNTKPAMHAMACAG